MISVSRQLARIVSVSRIARGLLVLCLVLCGLAQTAAAQDPGARDTVELVCDGLIVGQSRPVGMRIANDSAIAAMGISLEWEEESGGGFALLDSVVFVGRLADPSVLPVRYANLSFIGGVSKDSVVLGIYNLGGFDLSPGNDIVMNLYFTGLEVGSMLMDTGAIMGTEGILLNTPTAAEYKPVFASIQIPIGESSLPPILTLPPAPIPVTPASQISFDVVGVSPEGWPLVLTVTSLTGFDDSTETPSGSYGFTGGNPRTFSWMPDSADIGVWRAGFMACDSSAKCATGEVVLQVVSDEAYIVEFETVTNLVVDKGIGLIAGDFDDDFGPEIYLFGLGGALSGTDMLYSVDAQAQLHELYNLDHPDISAGVRSAFIDSDNHLDLISRRLWSLDQMLGDGSGNFESQEVEASQMLARSGAVGEFDGDSYLDYVCGAYHTLEVYTGSDSGWMSLAHTYTTSDTVVSLDGADFDDDGDRDLAVGTRAGLTIYENDGAGNFSAGATYSQSFGTVDLRVTNGGSDFNDDDYYDLSLATPSVGGTTGEIVLYYGNGDATFSPTLIRNVRGQIVATSPGDFNNDTYLDLAFTNSALGYVGILFGDGSGSFDNEIRMPIGGLSPRGMTCADFDADGDLDVFVNCSFSVAVARDSGTIVVLVNQTNPQNFTARSVEIRGDNNVAVRLLSASGYELSVNKSTFASGLYYERRGDDTPQIDQTLMLTCVESQPHVVEARPKPGAAPSETFSLSFTVDGVPYRLAENAPMVQGGYDFPVILAGGSPVLPKSGSFSHNAQPTFIWQESGEYLFELATDPEFGNIVESAPVAGLSYALSEELSVADTSLYYWRLRESGKAISNVIYVLNVVAVSQFDNGDVSGDGVVNIADVTSLVDWLFVSGTEPPNPSAGDVNGSGHVSLTDLTYLVNFLFLGGPAPM